MGQVDKLAAHGGDKAITDEIRRCVSSWPPVYPEVGELLGQIYESRAWSFNGDYEQRFTRAFAEYHGARHGVFMVNGTVTLEAALAVLGVGPGDEVIVPALTWIATAAAVIYVGATPVFVDIEPDTHCMAPAKVEEAVTDRTKVIIPVYLYGSMPDMDAVMEIGERRGVPVVEDGAHAHGSAWDGRGAGSIGAIGSFSFQQSKGLASGEGGICITNDDDLAEKLFRFKHIGYDAGATRGKAETSPPPGLICRNYRGTEFHAAILLESLKHLREQTERREAGAKHLTELIEAIPGADAQARGRLAGPQGYYNFAVTFDPDELGGLSIEQIKAALEAEGLPTYRTYGPVYGHVLWNVPSDLYRIAGGGCPVTDRAHDTTLTIDHTWLLAGGEVIEAMGLAIGKVARGADAIK